MIGPAAPLSSNNLIATSVLKLLGTLASVSSVASSKVIVAGTSPLVSAGPLGTIKDPTAASAMSIVQLGSGEAHADQGVTAMRRETAAEAAGGTYAQTIEQEYAANVVESSQEPHIAGQTENSAAVTAHVNADAGSPSPAPNPAPSLAQTQMGNPLLFIPAAPPYAPPALRKSRVKSAKLRASWQFLFGKNDDLDR
jgi:hypothetical protein